MKTLYRKDGGWKPIHQKYKASKKKIKHKVKGHLKLGSTRTPKVFKKKLIY
jgi:hypothetical protein